ncbi:MFS transporter [Streptomyces sp. NPDC002838]|uniref:MFS transporter n=1 Tax=Streptomyces sp. NPDC002838 TaxID=3154436 RepID=UPI003316FF81
MSHPLPRPVDDPEATAPRPGVIVAVLAFDGIVVALMQTLVIPIVPELPQLLNAPASDTAWAVTATLLAAAVAVPMMGRLGDMYGKRRMLLLSLVLLVAGSIAAALSDSLTPMIVGRLLQGTAGGVIPLGISIMRDELPAERLGSATAMMSASLGVGAALRLPAAALIADNFDWHMLFWSSGAMGAVALLLVLLLVPESKVRTGGRFDLIGGLGMAAGLVCLLLAISKGGDWGWGSGTILGLFAAAVVILLVWGWRELRTQQPLVDLRTTARRQVLFTNLASIALGFGMFAMSLVLPQLLQLPEATGYGLGKSLLTAGLVLKPFSEGRATGPRLVVICARMTPATASSPSAAARHCWLSRSRRSFRDGSLRRRTGRRRAWACSAKGLRRRTWPGSRCPWARSAWEPSAWVRRAPGPRPRSWDPVATEPEPTRRHAPSLTSPTALPGEGDEYIAGVVEGGAVADGIPVSGHVLGAERAPVAGAAVTLISLGGKQLGRSVSGGDGTYGVDAPAAGSYVLIASADGYQPQASTIVVAGDAPVSYDALLSGTSGLAGVVLSVDSGAPVAEAVVIVTDVRGDVLATGRTGVLGEFTVTDLVPGTVTLAVNSPKHRPLALPVEIGGTGITRIEVELRPGAHVRGTVRGAGTPLGDSLVTLVDAAGNVVATTTTDLDGAYAFSDLDGGAYTVTATGYPPQATTVTISGTGVDDHDIELAHAGE